MTGTPVKPSPQFRPAIWIHETAIGVQSETVKYICPYTCPFFPGVFFISFHKLRSAAPISPCSRHSLRRIIRHWFISFLLADDATRGRFAITGEITAREFPTTWRGVEYHPGLSAESTDHRFTIFTDTKAIWRRFQSHRAYYRLFPGRSFFPLNAIAVYFLVFQRDSHHANHIRSSWRSWQIYLIFLLCQRRTNFILTASLSPFTRIFVIFNVTFGDYDVI